MPREAPCGGLRWAPGMLGGGAVSSLPSHVLRPRAQALLSQRLWRYFSSFVPAWRLAGGAWVGVISRKGRQ